MLSVEEALEKILNFVTVLKSEENPLINCLGQVLSKDIIAPFDVPPADNSAMDGYAAQANSIYGATGEKPKILRVIGEVPAGSIADCSVMTGTTIRIMTGAVIPEGADVVIPFEETDEDKRKGIQDKKSEIGIYNPLKTGANIRKKGEDVSEGKLVMKQGKLLFPADIGVLASLGKAKVSVIRRPVVGILATGNEVLDVSQPLSPGKIYNSNSYSLAAQVIDCGGIPKILGIAQDDVRELTAALRRGLNCDILVTSGGVSVGDYDMVKQVLADEGEISFWTVRMKPGKPLAFGAFKNTNGSNIPHLGLPGNPVSSMITFEIFVRPALYKMMGRSDWARPMIKAVAEDSLKNKDERRIFARVLVAKRANEYYIRLTGEQGSGILTSMAMANGLAIIPETISEVKPGTILDVMMLNWDGLMGLQKEGEY
jgi:molybdopterin molybdotransferase